MKLDLSLFFLFLIFLTLGFLFFVFKGRLEQPRLPTEWIGLNDKTGQCLDEMRKQIQMEINASNIYLAMASHFSRDVVNRPGFAEHFFKSAREEREHGTKLIEYLSMRGQLTDSVTDLIQLIVSTHKHF